MRKKNRFNIISAILAVAVLCTGFFICDMDTHAADKTSVTVKVSMKEEAGTVAVTGMEDRTIPAGKTENYVFTCTEPGTSVYEAKQISTVPGAEMDDIVYEVIVYAQYEENVETGIPQLKASAYVQEKGKTEKKDEISFHNTMAKTNLPETPKDPESPETPKDPDHPKTPDSPDTGKFQENSPSTGKTAQTGDRSSTGVWMDLLTLAMFGFVFIFCCRKEKEGRNMQ